MIDFLNENPEVWVEIEKLASQLGGTAEQLAGAVAASSLNEAMKLIGNPGTWAFPTCCLLFARWTLDGIKADGPENMTAGGLLAMMSVHHLRELRVRARRVGLDARPVSQLIAEVAAFPLANLVADGAEVEAKKQKLGQSLLKCFLFMAEIEDEEKAKGVVAPKGAPMIPSMPAESLVNSLKNVTSLGPQLDQDELAILDELYRSPSRMSGAQLEAAFSQSKRPLSRKTIHKKLSALRENALIDRPKGERGGERITELGIEVLTMAQTRGKRAN